MGIKLGTRVGLLNNRGFTGTVVGVRKADQNTFYQVIINHTHNCKRDPEIYLCPEDELMILSNPRLLFLFRTNYTAYNEEK